MDLYKKLDIYETKLPSCCMDYLDSLVIGKQDNTILAYAQDLVIFFEYVTQKIERFKGRTAVSLTEREVFSLTEADCIRYSMFLLKYKKDGKERKNTKAGAKRKIVAARNLFQFFYKQKKIRVNPMNIIETPAVSTTPFVALEQEEIDTFMNNVANGDSTFTDRQLKIHEHERNRDLAIVSLLLSTGIRVSECANIDIDDIDINSCSISIVRKGGHEAFVYFSNEAQSYMESYLNDRKQIEPADGSKALFLSRLNKRLSVRSIQNLVKKYSKTGISQIKNIHPHTLRKTFGVTVYRETGDIKALSSLLGHSNISITDKTYSGAIQDDKRQQMRNIIRLNDMMENTLKKE